MGTTEREVSNTCLVQGVHDNACETRNIDAGPARGSHRAPAAGWRADGRPGRGAGDAGGRAAAAPDDKGTLEIYGFGQADAIADFKQNNPDWYDVNRPSRLPNVANQFGQDGHFYLSARQSRLGVKGEMPTANGPVKGQFEIDMFGVGRDAGQTTIRLRHAWGQWKQVGAGQTNSQFMDVDVFPNVLDYWGPNGMLFFRNVQVFWEPFNDGDLERAHRGRRTRARAATPACSPTAWNCRT